MHQGNNRSWEDLEASKTRALEALSRVEYFGSSQSRFYDFRRAEHKDTEFAVRTARTLPGHGNNADFKELRVNKLMVSSPTRAGDLLTSQKDYLVASPKNQRRLNTLNRFVEDSEKKRHGAFGVDAAKKAASGSSADWPELAPYEDVIMKPGYVSGQQPMLSVKLQPYMPPEGALKHGMSQTFGSLPSLSTSTSRMAASASR
jgi:hypothetical protein